MIMIVYRYKFPMVYIIMCGVCGMIYIGLHTMASELELHVIKNDPVHKDRPHFTSILHPKKRDPIEK